MWCPDGRFLSSEFSSLFSNLFLSCEPRRAEALRGDRRGRGRGGGLRRRGMFFGLSSISSSVVRREREKRTLARARAGGRPMAVRTWEGSAAPDWQAEPPLAEMP